MNDKTKNKQEKEMEGYICFDDTPEDLSDYLDYLKDRKNPDSNSKPSSVSESTDA